MKDDSTYEEQDLNEVPQNIVEQPSNSENSAYQVPSKQSSTVKYQLSGMYRDWFLDYASYVILERAVPDLYDGLKPVQRRILHSMKRLDDGRYNKVANIVGHTMQFHPHGDASIGDALVQLGQKDLLIDCQGNWGNILTGDGAAAPRYIEARLSKFATDAVFNPKITEWKLSYDGRNKEPIALPIKFPLLLAQGVEGIAVGLNSKILPHNFNELIDASVACLRNEEFQLFPDFQTGGFVDVSRYNDGARGGSVKVRAKITKRDNKTLVISEIPFGTNTGKLIESIIKASDKGKIKIRKVDDNTSSDVEILVHLQTSISSDKTIDALYAFTDCEQSISPNCCVIHDKKPIFTSVSNLLKSSTQHTKNLLKLELEIQRGELQEQYFFVSLEKIFIENRIYKEQQFENSTSQDEAIAFIDSKLEPFKASFIREVNREDIQRLLEIKMMRITKFDSDKANDLLLSIQEKIQQVEYNLNHLVKYTIDWFLTLQKKYGAAYPRRTELRNFENIVATKVIEANEKLYFDRAGGFIGTSLKKNDFVCNCSEIDDIILFYKDGKYKVVRVAEKQFVGPNVIHLNVFKKNDKRTIYNVAYRDGKDGDYFIKRFAVTGITRDKEYDLTAGTNASKVVYFTENPNGEAEIIKVVLRPNPRVRKNIFEKDFSEIAVKGRQSRGNLLSKNDIQKITLKQKGGSTLGGRKVWFDADVLRLNYDKRGTYLGEFSNEDAILVIQNNGDYYTTTFDATNHFPANILRIEKFSEHKIWTLALWDAEQKFYYLKRFTLDATNKTLNFVGENSDSKIVVLSDAKEPKLELSFGGPDAFREAIEIGANEFIGLKSYKAKGKRLTTFQVDRIIDRSIVEDALTENDIDDTDDIVDNFSAVEFSSEITPEVQVVTSVIEQIQEENQDESILVELKNETKEIATKVKDLPTEHTNPTSGTKSVVNIEMEIVSAIPEDSLPAASENPVAKRTRKKGKNNDDTEQMSLF